MNATHCSPDVTTDSSSASREVDSSCRVPLFVLFVSSAVWLAIYSTFSLIASIKFHSPTFLSDSAWLTYGRVFAAANHALLYGFAIQAGLGVALWIVARLSQAPVAHPWIVAVGGKLWNLGVTIGLIGILLGGNTGYERLEMPYYAAVFVFLGYVVVGFHILFTLHTRRVRALEAPQWFLVAAIFWFAWIFSTAQLLLSVWPVRGVTQAVVNWWYAANLDLVWLGLVGLATAFFFMNKFSKRGLHSQYLALFTFWTVILFASWSGIPAHAPLPAWIPALSTIATVLTVTTVLAVVLNVYKTASAGCSHPEIPVCRFIAFGIGAFVLAWVMNIAAAIPGVGSVTYLTWFSVAQAQLNTYGFFAITMFGAMYFIVPLVTGLEWPFAKLVRLHFWLAIAGIVLIVLPLAVGGIIQGFKLDGQAPFLEVTKTTLHFLRVSTLGELLVLVGHLLLLGNIAALSVRYYRTHFLPAYAEATAELKPAEVKP
jgi:cytochrome c oxidase cbb3-type subunit I